MTGPARPNPGMMPKRTNIVPPAPSRPARAEPPWQFEVDTSIPRCGVAEAVVWPDTSVLLSVHAPKGPGPAEDSGVDMPGRFRAHYNRRTRLVPRVASELRSLSWTAAGDDARLHRLRAAADNAVKRLLLGERPLVPQELQAEDAKTIEELKAQLRAVPGADQDRKKHHGEAEIIALAAKAASRGGVHLLLANDAGASIVARQHRLSTRHSADVLGELACADPDLDASTCMRHFGAGDQVSGVPRGCKPSDESAFACARNDGGCALCEPLATGQA